MEYLKFPHQSQVAFGIDLEHSDGGLLPSLDVIRQ